MTWGSKGKGKGAPSIQGKGKGAEVGMWVWSPGGSKGGGQGPKQQTDSPMSPTHHGVLNQNNQLKDNIAKLKTQLAQAQASQQQTTSDTKQVLSQGKKLLEQEDPTAPVLVCPVCQCQHYNLLKIKCRNKACKADLQSHGTIPASKLVQTRLPRNPLLNNAFQALLADAGAVACLKKNIVPEVAKEPQADQQQDADEPVDEAATEGTIEDTRTKAQAILKYLQDAKADPELIQAQLSKVNALPKPRQAKATQPLLDTGRLTTALSQTIEYHEEVALKMTMAVSRCEQVLADAKAALETAKQQQVEHQHKAHEQIHELRALIQQKQEQAKPDLALPVSQQQADQQLMMGDLQNWLLKAGLPPQLQTLLGGAQIRFGNGPALSFTIGGDPGAEQGLKNAVDPKTQADPAPKPPPVQDA
jgi:hypothetical protein